MGIQAAVKSRADHTYRFHLLVLPLFFILLYLPFYCTALVFRLPPPSVDVVGDVQYIKTKSGDDFETVARRYNVGFYEMVEANPNIHPFKKMSAGNTLLIPSGFILPPGPREGIVINLSELRLYHFMPERGIVATYPVGIGREGWETPTANTSVVRKKANPTWRVPQSIKRAAMARDVYLPDVVPPGPKNPLGKHAVYLGLPRYLLHGTIAPEGVGKRVSHGCLRLFPEDIEELFHNVAIGTKVRIVHYHAQAGWDGNNLLLEVHKPLKEYVKKDHIMRRAIMDMVLKTAGRHWNRIDINSVKQAIDSSKGIPIKVGDKHS